MARRTVGDMLKLVRSMASVLARRFRGRAVLELENLGRSRVRQGRALGSVGAKGRMAGVNAGIKIDR
jgi:hypothetical protein